MEAEAREEAALGRRQLPREALGLASSQLASYAHFNFQFYVKGRQCSGVCVGGAGICTMSLARFANEDVWPASSGVCVLHNLLSHCTDRVSLESLDKAQAIL